MVCPITQGDHKEQCTPTRPQNMVNFGLLAAEIGSLVWDTRANFNGFRVLVALLHGTLQGGPKMGPPWFFKQLSEKLTDFSNFWYSESRRNVTSDDNRRNTHACKMQPLYLVKSRQLSSDRSQCQIKCSIWPPFGCTTHSRRRCHLLMFLSLNACDSCCQALTIACFSSTIDVNCDVGVPSSKQTIMSK